MSDNDPTKDIGAKYDTGPPIETLVQMIADSRDEMRERFDRIESLLDRTASATFETRADLRDLKKELREHFPSVK